MRANKLYADLKKICKNTAFSHFTQEVKPPYIVYLQNIEQTGGDYTKKITTNNYTIELYTNARDMKLEAEIETLLQSYGVDYSAEYGITVTENNGMMSAFYFTVLDK